jgi:prevent-host-death family protein
MTSVGVREIPITEAREQLTSLPEVFDESPATVAVTRRGKPVLAVMPWELYEAMVETLEVMSDESMLAGLRQAIDEIAAGEAIDWERAKREL